MMNRQSPSSASGGPPRFLALRLLLVACGVLFGLEALSRASREDDASPLVRFLATFLGWPLSHYEALRAAVMAHRALSGAGAVAGLVVILLVYRAGLLVWHNHLYPRLSGTQPPPEQLSFPLCSFDLLMEIARRPKGYSFVGMTPRRRRLFKGWTWKPVYISQRQKTMHRQVIGKTGSGKTLSVLWPSVLQDALDGKGILVMDAKGSDENIQTMKGIAKLAGRESALRVFALPAWNQPQLFSHSYNMLYVRPRRTNGPSDPGGDAVATAERVFSILTLGDNEYYNTQAQNVFINLVRLMHGMVDGKGVGIPFTMLDLSVALKGVGGPKAWRSALNYCLRHSLNQEAAREIQSQVSRLGKDVHKCFSGVIGAVDKFLSPLVNAYAPDIVLEQALERNLIVYVQLPANLFKLQAPAMGRVMLMDVQQEGSLRQVFRGTRNQHPFAVVVDEFYNFADLSIIDSLNKLRDANLEYTLAHQSMADLELKSLEFAQCVWDNTRTKDILNQDNPKLCELVSKSIGTHQVVERTERQQRGALFTSLKTGDASEKRVEAYRLHPNAIKALARSGQGYLFNDEGLKPISYGMLPTATLALDYALPCNDQSNAPGLRLYEQFIAGADPKDLDEAA